MSLKPVMHISFQVNNVLEKLCMELMLTYKHSVGFVMESITSESVDSGQGSISPLNINAYSWLLHIRSFFFQIQPIILKQYNCSLLLVPLYNCSLLLVPYGKSNPAFLIYRFKCMNPLSYARGISV